MAPPETPGISVSVSSAAKGTAEERARILSFYAAGGEIVTPANSEQFLVAWRDGGIVGAVRLCEEEGHAVLRTMLVGKDFRRQGIGSRLLRVFGELTSDRTCYCIPYRRLGAFYSRVGFQETDIRRAPAFLRDRLPRYILEGNDAILMTKFERFVPQT